MATLAALLPQLRLKAINAAGAVMPGALLYTWEAGQIGTVALATYSDVALTTPNANPVVADAGGMFGPIYLSNSAAYGFDLQTSAGVSLFTQDNVYSPGYLAFNATQSAIAALCQGRLTLTTATPVTTADVTAAVSVLFTPYAGNGIGLYDGTIWQSYTFTEKTLSIAGFAADTPFDVWGRISAGALAIDSTAWTNTTTRATALALQDGVLVKSGDATRRYLGTFCTTGVVGQTEDSFAKRLVWNYYNRVTRPMRVIDTTDSWAYTTATVRQANASTANQLEFVRGVDEDPVSASVHVSGENTSAAVQLIVGIGLDSTSAMATSSGELFGGVFTEAATNRLLLRAELIFFPTIGKHVLTRLEYSQATGATTWYGDNGASATGPWSGIQGSLEG